MSNKTKKDELLKKTITIIKDKFWLDDMDILLRSDRMDEFFPSNDMTLEEKLNSLTRLSVYLSVALTLCTGKCGYLYIAILTKAIYILLMYSFDMTELLRIAKVSIMSARLANNPFMNILPDDYIKQPNRESLNKLNQYRNPVLSKYIEEKCNYNLYQDADDIFNRNTTQRQFYTMPVTTIPNEQGKLGKWLYQTPPTCKEGNGDQCVKYNWEFLKDSKIRNGIF